jgi:hypothetical protein
MLYEYEGIIMLDLAMLAMGFGAFALLVFYAFHCDRL